MFEVFFFLIFMIVCCQLLLNWCYFNIICVFIVIFMAQHRAKTLKVLWPATMKFRVVVFFLGVCCVIQCLERVSLGVVIQHVVSWLSIYVSVLPFFLELYLLMLEGLCGSAKIMFKYQVCYVQVVPYYLPILKSSDQLKWLVHIIK